jgi:H+/Cl- antiporter ClcA
MAHGLSRLAYDWHVGPVVLAVVIGLVTGFAAIGFRESIRFFNFILLELAWAWAEATPPYGSAVNQVLHLTAQRARTLVGCGAAVRPP